MDRHIRRTVMDRFRKVSDIVDDRFGRRSQLLMECYRALPKRFGICLELYELMCDRQFYEKTEDGRMSSKWDRRWTKCISTDEMKKKVSKSSCSPSKTYVQERLKAIENQAIFFPFTFGSNRWKGISRTWTYVRYPFQWGPFQKGSMDGRTELLKQNAATLCPATVSTLARAYKDACWVVTHDQATKRNCSPGELLDAAMKLYAGRFIGNKIGRLPAKISKEITLFDPKTMMADEYLEVTLPAELSRFDEYEGIVIDPYVIMNSQLPQGMKTELIRALEQADSGSRCDNTTESSLISSLFSTSLLGLGETRVPTSLELGKTRVPIASSTEVNQLPPNDLQTDDPPNLRTPLRREEEYIVKEDDNEGVVGDEESNKGVRVETLSDNNENVKTSTLEKTVNAIPKALVMTKDSKEWEEMGREFNPMDKEEKKERIQHLRKKKPKSVMSPASQNERDIYAKLREVKVIKPSDDPTTGEGFYRLYKATMFSRFPDSVPLRKQFSGDRIKVQKNAALFLLDLLQTNKCKNAITIKAWIEWYVRSKKPADVDEYGANLDKMSRTWKRFQKVRPSTVAKKRPAKQTKDFIGQDLGKLFKGDKYSPTSVCRACKFYGLVIVANWIKIKKTEAFAEQMIEEAIEKASTGGYSVARAIFAKTMKNSVGMAAGPDIFLGDWVKRFHMTWAYAGCTEDKYPKGTDSTKVDLFFSHNNIEVS